MSKQVQKFNVLCVTKRRKDNQGHPLWHLPITGTAEVVTTGKVKKKKLGVRITKTTTVHFSASTHNGNMHKLLYVREDLNGSAVVLAIELNDYSDPYNVLELYTDTPAGKVLPETIRKTAQSEIENHALDNRRTLDAVVATMLVMNKQ